MSDHHDEMEYTPSETGTLKTESTDQAQREMSAESGLSTGVGSKEGGTLKGHTYDKRMLDWLQKNIEPIVESRYGKEFYDWASLATFVMKCDCMECAPECYEKCEDGVLHFPPGYASPKEDLALGRYDAQSYEALQLARYLIDSFARPVEQMSKAQIDAMAEFKKKWYAIGGWRDQFAPARDMSHIPGDTLPGIASLLNRIFFASSLPIYTDRVSSPTMQSTSSSSSEQNLEIQWNKNLEDKGALGYTILSEAGKLSINIHPFKCNKETEEQGELAEERLGTIIHEMVHGFLAAYACKNCPTVNSNLYRCDGHGRAWHVIVKAIEEQTVELLGTKILPGREGVIKSALNNGRRGPSMHDLVQYGFLIDKVEGTQPTSPPKEASKAEKRKFYSRRSTSPSEEPDAKRDRVREATAGATDSSRSSPGYDSEGS